LYFNIISDNNKNIEPIISKGLLWGNVLCYSMRKVKLFVRGNFRLYGKRSEENFIFYKYFSFELVMYYLRRSLLKLYGNLWPLYRFICLLTFGI